MKTSILCSAAAAAGLITVFTVLGMTANGVEHDHLVAEIFGIVGVVVVLITALTALYHGDR